VNLVCSKSFNNNRLNSFMSSLKTIQNGLGIKEGIPVNETLDLIDFHPLLIIDKAAIRDTAFTGDEGPIPFLVDSVDARKKLGVAGVPTLPGEVVFSKQEALTVARKLTPPFRVYTSYTERFSLYAEDIGLAYIQAVPNASHGVVVESTAKKNVLSALVCMHPAGHYFAQWFETKWMSEHLQFPIRIRSLQSADMGTHPAKKLLDNVVDALGLTSGLFKIEFVETQTGDWVVRHSITLTMSDWLPLEWWQTELGQSVLSSVVQCSHNLPLTENPSQQQSVVQWLETHSGVVKSVKGGDAAAAQPGIITVELAVREGDIMRHVVDKESREKVGFVIAEGANTEEATARIEAAIQKIEIETENILETPFDA